MPDIILRPAALASGDVRLFAGDARSLSLWLYPSALSANDITLRPWDNFPVAVVVIGGGGFPTQFSGLRCYYGGTVRELCLVAVADAPTGLGGAIYVRKNATTYAVYLVETGDANASSVRIRTSAGTKSIRLKT